MTNITGVIPGQYSPAVELIQATWGKNLLPWRWSNLRVVNINPPSSTLLNLPFSLWWIALAAADETLQGGAMTTAWLRLFQTHLSTREATLMRWRGDLAESAEMRRAYSALYGRYFARALLASRLGLTDFVSLRRNVTTIPSGVTVRRISQGDIPDWIAWDPGEGGYVLAEAKGNLTGTSHNFQQGTPACIGAGKAQFGRVEVKDVSGTNIATRNWVAASLWSTDTRRRIPVSVLWDPPGEGAEIPREEVSGHAAAIRARKFNALAPRLVRSTAIDSTPGFRIRISAQPSEKPAMPPAVEIAETVNSKIDERILPIETSARHQHSDVYMAALMTPFGVAPIRSEADIQLLLATQKSARRVNEPAMVFGVSLQSISDQKDRALWLSANGIAAPDGLSLFNLRDVTIEPVGDIASP